MEQLGLFADTTKPVPIIRCPDCGYCPAERTEPSEYLGIDDRSPVTVDEQLNEFEVVGCCEGNIMCRECACEFPWPPN